MAKRRPATWRPSRRFRASAASRRNVGARRSWQRSSEVCDIPGTISPRSNGRRGGPRPGLRGAAGAAQGRAQRAGHPLGSGAGRAVPQRHARGHRAHRPGTMEGLGAIRELRRWQFGRSASNCWPRRRNWRVGVGRVTLCRGDARSMANRSANPKPQERSHSRVHLSGVQYGSQTSSTSTPRTPSMSAATFFTSVDDFGAGRATRARSASYGRGRTPPRSPRCRRPTRYR